MECGWVAGTGTGWAHVAKLRESRERGHKSDEATRTFWGADIDKDGNWGGIKCDTRLVHTIPTKAQIMIQKATEKR